MITQTVTGQTQDCFQFKFSVFPRSTMQLFWCKCWSVNMFAGLTLESCLPAFQTSLSSTLRTSTRGWGASSPLSSSLLLSSSSLSSWSLSLLSSSLWSLSPGGVHPPAQRDHRGLRRAARRREVPQRGEDQDHRQHLHGGQRDLANRQVFKSWSDSFLLDRRTS